MSTLLTIRPEEYRPGDQIDQYRLLERIGYGGQAVVWSAIDGQDNSVVALKLFEYTPPEQSDIAYYEHLLLSGAPRKEDAFEQQSKLLASLNHPNILPLRGSGGVGKLRYQATPYIAAGSLRELLDITHLSRAEFIRLATQIASALEYLHQQHVVHRDLKATNVLVDFGQRAYLADFGLARVLSQSTQPLHTGRGTPPYASPEQHATAKITAQSDIYSLGIMFFEMLTRELPWRGEKSLGIQQLTNPADSLPDPREVNTSVPPRVASALRVITAADPKHRPATALEALRLVLDAFDAPIEPDWTAPASARSDQPLGGVGEAEASSILQHGHNIWLKGTPGIYPLTITRFILVDAAFERAANGAFPVDTSTAAFMLHGALLYGHRADHWWKRVSNPSDKLTTCARALQHTDPAAIERTLTYLSEDASIASAHGLAPATIAPLFSVIDKGDEATGGRLLSLIGRAVARQTEWRRTVFTVPDDLKLAEVALSDQPYADDAAILIGQVRSESAAQALAADLAHWRSVPALTRALEGAGNLPDTLPIITRLRASANLLYQQIAANPIALIRAYLATALGCLVGFGSYAYAMYRLPVFLDAQRFFVALERGALLAVLFAFGLFIVRAITTRLKALSLVNRLATALVTGSICMMLSIFSFDILILDNPPTGWLIPAGCLLIALSASLSAQFVPSRWGRMVIEAGVSSLVIVYSWTLHVNSGAIMHPFLFFEYAWSAAQVWGVALATTLPISIGGNAVDT